MSHTNPPNNHEQHGLEIEQSGERIDDPQIAYDMAKAQEDFVGLAMELEKTGEDPTRAKILRQHGENLAGIVRHSYKEREAAYEAGRGFVISRLMDIRSGGRIGREADENPTIFLLGYNSCFSDLSFKGMNTDQVDRLRDETYAMLGLKPPDPKDFKPPKRPKLEKAGKWITTSSQELGLEIHERRRFDRQGKGRKAEYRQGLMNVYVNRI